MDNSCSEWSLSVFDPVCIVRKSGNYFVWPNQDL